MNYMEKSDDIKLVAQNKKAAHDYFVLEKYEAGIVLLGTEVKSLRERAVNMSDSYASFKKGELFIVNMHISPYHFGNRNNHEPLRERKLLMKKRLLMTSLFALASIVATSCGDDPAESSKIS